VLVRTVAYDVVRGSEIPVSVGRVRVLGRVAESKPVIETSRQPRTTKGLPMIPMHLGPVKTVFLRYRLGRVAESDHGKRSDVFRNVE